uniref:C2H2-type domain-containing protein n=1 Tax=Gopherus agassizii TaxID=38772 RepID=A0A452GH38_9SAUR
ASFFSPLNSSRDSSLDAPLPWMPHCPISIPFPLYPPTCFLVDCSSVLLAPGLGPDVKVACGHLLAPLLLWRAWWSYSQRISKLDLTAVFSVFCLSFRKLSGKAGIDEVMAAAVLTSLSTSPLVLGNPPGTLSPEPSCEAWKEGPAMSSSYSSSSNNSGDWNWDLPSDRSTPSTPSPPLSTDTEATHFLFGDPIPRKRKNSTKVMFKCLWKSCGKVLSSSSGMQKHIRTVHLGRKADLDQSDGEEDFYYTELDVNVDSLTDGLSSLTPVSPTSSVPPAFPVVEVQRTPPVLVKPEDSVESPLSHSAPTNLCHVHTDHAYQVGHVEKQVRPHWVRSGACHPDLGSQPRGEAKKCRKVYGMENRDMWCTACRWKKACQRFVD